MIIGIDASRAFIDDRTGTENYSYHVITQILQLPEAKKHGFVLFTRPNAKVPSEIGGYDNVIVKNINFKYLWTQVGLAWETWKKPQIDVLWIPAHTLPILRMPGIQTVVTIHGLEYQWLPEYKNILQKWYLPLSTYYAAKEADGIIAVSEFTAKQLQKETHISKKKIKVIHEGVELHTPGVKGANTPGVVGPYILFVGSVQPRKNLVALVEAFSQLRLHLRGDMSQIKLVIAGGIGWMAGDILQAPARFGVQEKVVFTGRISDLELGNLYSHALMYVQPSITEGFGLPVLEAMGHGIPVISSDGGALSEVVGSAGIIVSLNNDFVSELAKAMSKLCENSGIRTKLIAAGNKRVSELTWSQTAEKTLKFLINMGLTR